MPGVNWQGTVSGIAEQPADDHFQNGFTLRCLP
jgi:hypothetical protein